MIRITRVMIEADTEEEISPFLKEIFGLANNNVTQSSPAPRHNLYEKERKLGTTCLGWQQEPKGNKCPVCLKEDGIFPYLISRKTGKLNYHVSSKKKNAAWLASNSSFSLIPQDDLPATYTYVACLGRGMNPTPDGACPVCSKTTSRSTSIIRKTTGTIFGHHGSERANALWKRQH